MAAKREDWAVGFWRQSKSDWESFQILMRETTVMSSSSLHFLQMAGEKIAKAYRFRDTDTDIDDLLNSHVALSKFIPNFLRSPSIILDYKGRYGQLRAFIAEVRGISREVEKLAPSVDRHGSPENSEYPWAIGDKIVVPADYSFPNLWKLRTPAGVSFLNLLEKAIYDFESIKT